MQQINELFDKLDNWRHLPSYQLERRADIFFSLYLPELLSRKFGLEVEDVIPEFPIRVGTIDSNIDINKSFKVDYFAKVKSRNEVILVELKTDENSSRDKQDWYLNSAKKVGLAELLKGVVMINEATASKAKYRHLLAKLQDMGLVKLRPDGSVTVTPVDYEILIVYVQPDRESGHENVITFKEVADIVGQHPDELSRRFSESLVRWATVKAGED